MIKINLHNIVIFLLPILCVFQSYLSLPAGPLDLIFVGLLVVLVRRFVSGVIEIDTLSILLMLIVVLALATMFVFKISQTSWINVFRSLLYAMTIYMYVFNYRNRIDVNVLTIPFILINFFNIWVLLTTWSTGFTHHSTESGYFNLNNIGFMSLIILIMSFTMSLKNTPYRLVHWGTAGLSAMLVVMSFSRSNYLLLTCVTLFIVLFILDLKGRASFFSLGLVVIIFLIFKGGDSEILNYGLSFLDKKVNVGTAEDILLDRIYNVAIHPIDVYLEDKPFFYLFLGGGLIPDHSLIITHVTCFGFFSMFLYVLVTFNTIKHITHRNKSIKLASILMLVIFFNDSSTNASTYLAFVKLVPLAFFGIIVGRQNDVHQTLRW